MLDVLVDQAEALLPTVEAGHVVGCDSGKVGRIGVNVLLYDDIPVLDVCGCNAAKELND